MVSSPPNENDDSAVPVASTLASQRPAPLAEALRGLRVLAFEARLSEETAGIVRRYGGTPVVAPALREVALESNHLALRFGQGLLAGEYDALVFLTGVGVEALFRVLETRYERRRLLGALARVSVFARGPKPWRALRKLGFDDAIRIEEPSTWMEVVAGIESRRGLKGLRVAIQEYGISNYDLITALEARGAHVVSVPVYRWALPEDRGPLIEALKQVIAGEIEVVLFTTGVQVRHAFQLAAAQGFEDALRQALGRVVVASIGPVCSQTLRSYRLEPDLEPEHHKLAHLVREVALRGREILAKKRGGDARAAHALAVQTEGRVSRSDSAPSDGEREWSGRRNARSNGVSAALRGRPLMRALRRESVPWTPVWLMRQAGRYLPEYRAIRNRMSFLDMCLRPEVAAEIAVSTARRLGVDGAIIFSDILLPLLPLRVGLRYESGGGPVIERAVRSAEDVARLSRYDVRDALGKVGEAVRLACAELGDEMPLIGFAGAPFTLASYLIEGGGSSSYRATKSMMYNCPDAWQRLMTLLAQLTSDYLLMQVEAGASVVQLFDSWVGSLGPDDYRRHVLPYTAQVIAAVPADVPVIHFGTGTASLLELMRESGGDCIGLDWRISLAEAWRRIGYDTAVQGNLDPVALFADIPEIRARTAAILNEAEGRPGHVFNLGHGILPETPVDHVLALVDAVHELSQR